MLTWTNKFPIGLLSPKLKRVWIYKQINLRLRWEWLLCGEWASRRQRDSKLETGPAAGNEAFQARRYSEAIEHYSGALSRNVESRPFAAICFCNRAAAYKAMGQITDAIADCSLAIALDGNYLKTFSQIRTLLIETDLNAETYAYVQLLARVGCTTGYI
ncbi:unnamed protein product [Dovyalis caffra]|uniref:Uncharacterized protein n=1 Tax=Dovyalis caffra TaxID=77055 RepID=A0AAV1S4U9_9ROSI|nr:unnamed protein product [Dovyalis caffra]